MADFRVYETVTCPGLRCPEAGQNIFILVLLTIKRASALLCGGFSIVSVKQPLGRAPPSRV